MNSESSTQYTAIYNRTPIYRGGTLNLMRLTLVDKDSDVGTIANIPLCAKQKLLREVISRCWLACRVGYIQLVGH